MKQSSSVKHPLSAFSKYTVDIFKRADKRLIKMFGILVSRKQALDISFMNVTVTLIILGASILVQCALRNIIANGMWLLVRKQIFY